MDRLDPNSLEVETFETVVVTSSDPAYVIQEPASCIGRWCPPTEVDCNPY